MPNESRPTNPVEPHKTNRKLLTILAVVIIVILAAALIAAFARQNQQQPFPTPAVQQIVPGNFTVNAGSYTDYNFTVPADFSRVWVYGTFTVSDSAVSGINVYVMDNGNFTNWQNGQTANTYYDSGQVNAGTVNTTTLPSGVYYLVFDNTLSTASRNVTADVGLLLL